ncbi:cation transporter [Carnobacteriaceae bacterium zg-ZUI240]|nr:cation transporter [Carnobacteriaceae bacterium zg-ZUI240]
MHTQVKKMSFISIALYAVVAIIKLGVGFVFNSSAIQADGFNNFTDVTASVAIFIGLHIAHLPADEQHQYGHWKAESIASLIASFIMFYIGLQVLISAIQRIFSQEFETLDIRLIFTGLLSSAVFLMLYIINQKVALQHHSIGLKATAKNNLTDAITSLLSVLSIFIVNYFQWYTIDALIAVVIALMILHTGFSIFKETVFQLSDGFDEEALNQYKNIILKHPEIISIRQLKARHYGPNIYVDTTVIMNGDLTVHDSHQVTEDIENELNAVGVLFTDVHVEPYEKADD